MSSYSKVGCQRAVFLSVWDRTTSIRDWPEMKLCPSMKYSLRSLMRFSIRELFLITVIAAILAAWLADHRLQRGMREEAEKVRDQAEKNRRIADDRFTQAKSYLQSK